MTELIYQKHSYIKEFECRVIGVDEAENAIILDKTAFYIGGGGQPCDFGTLETPENKYIVKMIKKKGNEIYHYIDGELPKVNEMCIGKIDWEHRHKLMRTHTAMHILCGVVWRDYKAQVTGCDMDCLKGRMDFEFENFDKELVEEIEEKINKEVQCKRDIKVNILNREEAFKIPDLIRTKINLLPESIKKIRTVEIEGLDLQADGGTHVKNTSEVGKIKIVKFKSKGKINKRIYIEIED
ncbi:MAG: alanyl-tRNA editing protein [Clostridium sp.]|nr:alanyl-tRNA editing protein [Clostridium sp.]